MGIWIPVAAAATPTTNPDPNTLTTKSPWDASSLNTKISSVWISQGVKAIFPKSKLRDLLHQPSDRPFYIHFIPSGGEASQFSVVLWNFDDYAFTQDPTNAWCKAAGVFQATYTGKSTAVVTEPGQGIWYVQVTSVAPGSTLLITSDSRLVEVN